MEKKTNKQQEKEGDTLIAVLSFLQFCLNSQYDKKDIFPSFRAIELKFSVNSLLYLCSVVNKNKSSCVKVNESHFNFLRMIRAKILHFSEINFYCSERYFDSLLFEVYSIEQSL